jgi:hypothetical protein
MSRVFCLLIISNYFLTSPLQNSEILECSMPLSMWRGAGRVLKVEKTGWGEVKNAQRNV